jgi:hypothetical protein
MSAMTHPMPMPFARSFFKASTAKNTRANVEPEGMKSSVLQGISATFGILGIALASVLVPAFGPPSGEAAALMQAQEVQHLAQSWVAAHPEDAVPTGDPAAWGFAPPVSASASEDQPCAYMGLWTPPAGAC